MGKNKRFWGIIGKEEKQVEMRSDFWENIPKPYSIPTQDFDEP